MYARAARPQLNRAAAPAAGAEAASKRSEHSSMDILFLGITLAFFTLTAGLVRFCEKL